MHLAAYAGVSWLVSLWADRVYTDSMYQASTALATAVVLRAFQQRPNFYSAAVYLSQSNACLMVGVYHLQLYAILTDDISRF